MQIHLRVSNGRFLARKGRSEGINIGLGKEERGKGVEEEEGLLSSSSFFFHSSGPHPSSSFGSSLFFPFLRLHHLDWDVGRSGDDDVNETVFFFFGVVVVTTKFILCYYNVGKKKMTVFFPFCFFLRRE